ncbi:hypothetical protein GCM10027446_03550 [Angustibacter peucedani]
MSQHRGRLTCALVLVATVVQLVVASVATDLPQFAGKAFAARLVAYPVLMLLVPALWWVAHRRRLTASRPPWAGFALVMAPFLVDVTGNTLDLYDRVTWWDDANHFVNWFLLCLGLALVVGAARLVPGWARSTVVVGGGAVLALAWEVGEWFAFIRGGTELATAYQDTLGDMVLGTCGAGLAALVLARAARTAPIARP